MSWLDSKFVYLAVYDFPENSPLVNKIWGCPEFL